MAPAPPSPAPQSPECPPREGSAPLSRRALLEVVALCAVVWAALAAHAFAVGPVEVAGRVLRPGPLVEAVVGEARVARLGLVPSPRWRTPRRGVPDVVAPAGAPARAVDRSPQRILLFGDSMIEELMLRMADYCQANGHELYPAVWYAAGTMHWGQDDKLDRLIAERDPTVVIAVLGSNELTMRHIERRASAVRQIMTKVGDRPLLWVGPPNWTEDTGINDLLERTVGPARFFRSAELELARKPDGIHPTRTASATWMDAVARWIEEESAYPFILSAPQDEAPRPVARVFPPPGRG